jgi:diacylglycerol kinase (ATP)
MRTCIICNPNAGSAEDAKLLLEAARQRPETVWREPQSAAEAVAATAQAVREGYELVIAAGGDGTTHAVVNGLAGGFATTRLGIIPLGTGNDLPRTLAIPDDVQSAWAVVEQGLERRIDLIRVETATKSEYCVNVAAGGFAGEMQEGLADLKSRWGSLAYLFGAAGTLSNRAGYQVRLTLDQQAVEDVEALNIIVANGRTAAGGHRVAPHANPEDGLLDIVVVRNAPLIDLAAVGLQLVAGNYLEHEQVLWRRARQVRIESAPPLPFEIDGELFTDEPITFAIEPHALRVIVGLDYMLMAP